MVLKRENSDPLKDKKGKSCTWHIDIHENCLFIFLIVDLFDASCEVEEEEQVFVSAKLIGPNVLNKLVGLHYGRDWTCIVRFSNMQAFEFRRNGVQL